MGGYLHTLSGRKNDGRQQTSTNASGRNMVASNRRLLHNGCYVEQKLQRSSSKRAQGRISVHTGLLPTTNAKSTTTALLTNFFRYAYYQIRALSLPIPQAFAIITLLLPLATAFSTRTAYSLLRSQTARARPLLSLALFAFQLIYETIIATLSLTYMVPNCRPEEQWARLYTNKDAGAIRRIQDRFNCCGFNTAVDRAWPFPHGRPEDGFGSDQCRRMFGREMPCSGSWRQAEQLNAGAFFAVAIVIFVVKVLRAFH
jgi:hypothetical protein